MSTNIHKHASGSGIGIGQTPELWLKHPHPAIRYTRNPIHTGLPSPHSTININAFS